MDGCMTLQLLFAYELFLTHLKMEKNRKEFINKMVFDVFTTRYEARNEHESLKGSTESTEYCKQS